MQTATELRQERWDELYSIFFQLVEDSSCILHPLPPFEEFAHFKSVKKLWDLDDIILDADTFELALPDILSELVEKRKIFVSKQVDGIIKALLNLFNSINLERIEPLQCPILPTISKSYTPEEINSVQNLALARIRCKPCKRSYHLSEIFAHQCSDSKPRGQASLNLENYTLVQEKESRLVLDLLQLGGLLLSASHEDLIRIGNRYGCDICEESIGTVARTSAQIVSFTSRRLENRFISLTDVSFDIQIHHVLTQRGKHSIYIIKDSEIVETLMR